MPKQKTHKATAKRIKLTANNKLVRERANGTHFQTKKSASRKRVIASTKVVRGALAKNLKRALGV
jgi:large subunit ribosomal protein L35